MPKKLALISACALVAVGAMGGSASAAFRYGNLQCISLTDNQRYDPRSAVCFPPGQYWSFCGGTPGPGGGGGWLPSNQPCDRQPVPP